MHEVRDGVHVALSAPAAAVLAERLLKRQLVDQLLEIVHSVRVRGIADAGALLYVRVVPEDKKKFIRILFVHINLKTYLI